jgi:transcriptional regulator with XRE-family HTH domain
MPDSLHIANSFAIGKVCEPWNDPRDAVRYSANMAHSRPVRYTNWYLKQWIEHVPASQSEIAKEAGIPAGTMSLLVNSRQDYSPEYVRDLAKALNISNYELFMHPSDAMALRNLRKNALQVVRSAEALSDAADRTGTEG